MSDLINVPRIFFDDHRNRELPTPEVVAVRGGSYVIRRNDPNVSELLDDARFYVEMFGDDLQSCPRNVRDSARRTVAALHKGGVK